MPSQLPTLAELYNDKELAFKSDQLLTLLNQPVYKQWVKKHPMYKNDYLPVDKVELMMDKVFKQWRVEIISYSQLFQSIAAHVRLHYRNPVTEEWSFTDGAGASPVQVDAGKSAADLGAIKTSAVQMALPIAVTMAFKDAAERLGTVFGRDLNRKDTLQFEPYFKPSQENGTTTSNLPATAIAPAGNSFPEFSDDL